VRYNNNTNNILQLSLFTHCRTTVTTVTCNSDSTGLVIGYKMIPAQCGAAVQCDVSIYLS